MMAGTMSTTPITGRSITMRSNPLPIFAILAILFAYGMSTSAQKPAAYVPIPQSEPTPTPARTKPVTLTDFWAPWCGPCKKMLPIVKQLEDEGVRVTRINVDVDPEMAAQYGADQAIPLFVAMRDGKEIGRINRLCTLAELEALVGRKPSHAKVVKDPNPPDPDPVPQPSDKPAVGAHGWRLRLFYPKGNTVGEALAKGLCDNKTIRKWYGVEAATTDSTLFNSWRKLLPADKLTVVLAHPDGRIVYQSHNPPTDVGELHEVLRTAVRERDNL